MAYCKGTRNDSFEVEGQKNVYFLTTILSPPVVPAWLADDNAGSESEVVRNKSDVVCSRVKVRGC